MDSLMLSWYVFDHCPTPSRGRSMASARLGRRAGDAERRPIILIEFLPTTVCCPSVCTTLTCITAHCSSRSDRQAATARDEPPRTFSSSQHLGDIPSRVHPLDARRPKTCHARRPRTGCGSRPRFVSASDLSTRSTRVCCPRPIRSRLRSLFREHLDVAGSRTLRGLSPYVCVIFFPHTLARPANGFCQTRASRKRRRAEIDQPVAHPRLLPLRLPCADLNYSALRIAQRSTTVDGSARAVAHLVYLPPPRQRARPPVPSRHPITASSSRLLALTLASFRPRPISGSRAHLWTDLDGNW